MYWIVIVTFPLWFLVTKILETSVHVVFNSEDKMQNTFFTVSMLAPKFWHEHKEVERTTFQLRQGVHKCLIGNNNNKKTISEIVSGIHFYFSLFGLE